MYQIKVIKLIYVQLHLHKKQQATALHVEPKVEILHGHVYIHTSIISYLPGEDGEIGVELSLGRCAGFWFSCLVCAGIDPEKNKHS